MPLIRSISTLLAASFVGAVVAACGGETDQQSESPQLADDSEALKGGATFKCGEDTCKKKTEYCREVSGPGTPPPPGHGPTGPTHSSFCEKLPTECKAKPTCDCLHQSLSGICSGTASSGIKLELLMM